MLLFRLVEVVCYTEKVSKRALQARSYYLLPHRYILPRARKLAHLLRVKSYRRGCGPSVW